MAFTKDRSIFYSRRVLEIRNTGSSPTARLLGNVIKLQRDRTGVSQPNYRKLIKNQQNATTDMSGHFETYQGDAGGVWHLRHQDTNFAPGSRSDHIIDTRWTGDFTVLSFPINWWSPTITTAVAQNRASISFLKHCRAVQREFSSPTFMGELKETIEMIRKPGQGLRNLLGHYLTDVKKRKKLEPHAWKKNLSAAWLEHTFGWVPLASDLSSAYNAYRNLVTQHDDEQREVHGIGIEEKYIPTQSSYTSGNVTSGGAQSLSGYKSLRATEKAFVKYHGMVVRRVDATFRDKLARVGFEPSEFLPTAWELLPWSFLVDYFSNIGDVIESSMFNRALLAWAASDTIVSQKFQGMVAFDRALSDVTLGGGIKQLDGVPASFVAEKRTVNRAAVASIPSPTLDFEIPGSPAQWANMLALWVQASSIHPQQTFRGNGHW